MGPVIRFLLADCRRHGHLRHDGGAAAADQAFIDKHRLGTVTACRNCRIHACSAGTDHKNVCCNIGCHRLNQIPLIRKALLPFLQPLLLIEGHVVTEEVNDAIELVDVGNVVDLGRRRKGLAFVLGLDPGLAGLQGTLALNHVPYVTVVRYDAARFQLVDDLGRSAKIIIR